MASKVKDTPILRGKDAERFNLKMREADKNTIPKKEYERMMNVFNSVRIVETQ
ncbi:MAG: hypothetical protein PHQ03_08815 [Methylococcales bacterium]|nr:hypothetical protein [Methylococcales bacterium]